MSPISNEITQVSSSADSSTPADDKRAQVAEPVLTGRIRSGATVYMLGTVTGVHPDGDQKLEVTVGGYEPVYVSEDEIVRPGAVEPGRLADKIDADSAENWKLIVEHLRTMGIRVKPDTDNPGYWLIRVKSEGSSPWWIEMGPDLMSGVLKFVSGSIAQYVGLYGSRA